MHVHEETSTHIQVELERYINAQANLICNSEPRLR